MRYLLILLVLFSCTTEKQAIKKMAKYRVKFPQLFITDTVIIDTTLTVTIRDTFYLPGDSLIGVVPSVDTTIDGGRVSITFWKEKEVIKWKTKVKTDTVIIDSIIKVPVYIEKPCKEAPIQYIEVIPWWIYLIFALLALLLIYKVLN